MLFKLTLMYDISPLSWDCRSPGVSQQDPLSLMQGKHSGDIEPPTFCVGCHCCYNSVRTLLRFLIWKDLWIHNLFLQFDMAFPLCCLYGDSYHDLIRIDASSYVGSIGFDYNFAWWALVAHKIDAISHVLERGFWPKTRSISRIKARNDRSVQCLHRIIVALMLQATSGVLDYNISECFRPISYSTSHCEGSCLLQASNEVAFPASAPFHEPLINFLDYMVTNDFIVEWPATTKESYHIGNVNKKVREHRRWYVLFFSS